MSVLPCLLCGIELEKKLTKNGKPYFTCNSCGVQWFIRRGEGIEKLERLIKTLEDRQIIVGAHTHALAQVSAILQELDGVEHELQKLENSVGFFSKPSEEKLRAKELLKTRMQTLLNDLERIADGQ